MRGRKPKPTELKLLQGTFRQDRAPAAPPPATRQGTPHCPDDFDDEQRAEWKKLARQYRAEGRSIQPHEAGIHVGYVCLTVDLSRARRELRAVEEEVLNLPTAQGLPGLEHALVHAPSHLEEKRDRLLRRIRGLIQEHRSIAAELGLTPSARSRAGWGGAAQKKGDAAEDCLKEILG